MAVEAIQGPSRKVHLFHRKQATTFAAAATLATMARLEGHQRIVGSVDVSTAQADGYPRVRQSVDGVTWSIVSAIQRDTDQVGRFVYPIDVDIRLPYVQLQLAQGAVDSTYLYAYAWATPVPNLELDTSSGGGSATVASIPGTDFAVSLSSGLAGTADLVGLSANRGVIRSLTLISKDHLDFEVSFWSKDTYGSATLADDSFIESVTVYATQAIVIPNQPVGTNVYRYSISNLYIPYRDEDNSNELHVAIRPLNGSTTAGSNLKLAVGYEPEA